MVSTLRYAVKKSFGNIDYLHYFRRMIKDYELGKQDFDIRTIVKNIKIDIPCPKYVSKRGYSKRLCLTILDEKIFHKEFDTYLNGYVRPIQELRKNRIIARRILFKKYGYFTKYNQDCSNANYNCKICNIKFECDLSKRLSKKDKHIMRITRLFEILYGNLNRSYWANLIEEN